MGQNSVKSNGKVPHGSILEGHWQVGDHIPASEARRMATFSHYALASTHEALQDARLLTEDNNALTMDTNKVGVAVGSGIGSFEDIYNNSIAYNASGYKSSTIIYPQIIKQYGCREYFN